VVVTCSGTAHPASGVVYNLAQGYYALQPGRALKGIVEAIWLYDNYVPPHCLEIVLPSGTVELVINLAGEYLRCYHPETKQCLRLRSPLVTGVHHRHFVIDTAQQHTMMGVAFTPLGAWRWLGIPPNEFGNQHVELRSLVGHVANDWHDRLCEVPGPVDRLRRLQGLLEGRRLHGAHPAVEWAASQIVDYPEHARVDDLAAESELSTRRFSGLFTRQVGIAPKGFIRIRRFQAALAVVRKAAAIDWSRLALRAGYADQSHLIREFKSFTGFTPTAYAALHEAWQHHVPLPEQDQICPLPADLGL
jgi:AraC-like DNA-binding protein